MTLTEFTTKRRQLVEAHGKELTEGKMSEKCRKELAPLVKFSKMPQFRLVNSIVRDWLEANPNYKSVR